MMAMFALQPDANDFFAVGGFAVGVVGFAVTIWQLWKTRSAAKAAQTAAETTLKETRAAYDRIIGGTAYKFFSELRNYVVQEDWKLAATRADDLAD